MIGFAPPLSPMTFQDFRALCQARTSVRHYAPAPVTREVIEELLGTATLSPSVQNVQPWRFYVILDPARRRKLLDASCYGNFLPDAGAFILVTADTNARPPDVLWNPRELEYSCVCAMQTILLGATAMGLGSCWVSLHRGIAHELMDLPMHEAVVGGLMLGQSAPDEPVSPVHDRKPLAEIITFLPAP